MWELTGRSGRSPLPNQSVTPELEHGQRIAAGTNQAKAHGSPGKTSVLKSDKITPQAAGDLILNLHAAHGSAVAR